MHFRIRGAASINSGNWPLFVIDGLPTDVDLSNINPDEIESFSILKDAAASSLYGSRAANGVVLITTKRGKKGRTQVDLIVLSYGIQTMKGLNGFDMMNGEEFDTQPKHASSEIGTVRMKNLNDDQVIDADDRTKIGDPNPDFIYGITNEFSYKNFDLSILLCGQVGGDVLNSNYEQTLNLDGCFNVDRMVAQRWRSPENPGNGLVPRTKSGTTELFRYNNSSWVFDASYLCIKNITLGYTVPVKTNRYLSKLRIYVTAQQLATFTKYPGMNPEVSTNGLGWSGLGVDATTYPVPRTFSIGCNISF